MSVCVCHVFLIFFILPDWSPPDDPARPCRPKPAMVYDDDDDVDDDVDCDDDDNDDDDVDV